MIEYIRLCLLNTPQFEGWKDLPANFILEPVEEGSADLHLKQIPGHKITLTPRDITTDIPLRVNMMQNRFELTGGWISSGGPDGGTIRFQYKRKQ